MSNTALHLRPNMLPPRTWKLAGAGASSSNSSGSSSVAQDLGRSRDWTRSYLALIPALTSPKPALISLFFRDVVLTMVGTNALSLAIGIGFGYWVYRKSAS